jgi:hypothetical protein
MIYRRAGLSNRLDIHTSTDSATLAHLWATYFDNGTHTVRKADEFIEWYHTLVKPYLPKKAT